MSELLNVALEAAHAAGQLQRENFGSTLTVNEMLRHDIKLDLDVRSQQLITDILLKRFPDHVILGEEGNSGNSAADIQWIVDPIDGTVNYFYGIPHYSVSIAARKSSGEYLAGVIYDPMMDETWTVEKDGKPTLNGRVIRTSDRAHAADAVVTVGFSKSREALEASFDRYKRISIDVRKTRMLGSAALALAYIACGRLDGYIEEQLSEWDIAAGRMLVLAAGGEVFERPGIAKPNTLFICASNGKIDFSSYI
jgi:myo-inositol-1(or 4)-monophosphatase